MIRKSINKKLLCQYGFVFGALALISSCIIQQGYNMKPSEEAAQIAIKAATDLTPGEYKLDKTHASLIFRVNHLGVSRYVARFKSFDAKLKFDPQDPANSEITATVDPFSIETDYPEPKKVDFNAELRGDKWLNVKKYTNITFRSTKVELTGPITARIHGIITLHGVSKPLTIYAIFNGGYDNMPMDPSGSRIGFSARGAFNRSDFGISYGLPPKDSDMGVADMIEFSIEAEFTKPADKKTETSTEKTKNKK